MPKHLGRNPFEKGRLKAQFTRQGQRDVEDRRRSSAREDHRKPPVRGIKSTETQAWSRIADWALIQVPARSALFALRAALRVKDLLEKRQD